MNQMEKALSLMKNKEFIKAGKLYDELSVSLKDSSSKILMLFNAGVSYKEAGKCNKAILRQRSVLDHSLKIPELKARSLLELSYIYECLGNNEMTLLILKDLKKFREALPLDWNQILYPARLALAFARMDDKKSADEYNSLSLKKVLDYRKIFSKDTQLTDYISRIFYLMGRSYVKKENIKADSFLSAFFYHQLFLLQSLFLKDKIWSKMAENELNLLFDKLSFSLTQLPKKEKEKYKKIITKALKAGKALAEKEKSTKWINFYNKKYKTVLKFL